MMHQLVITDLVAEIIAFIFRAYAGSSCISYTLQMVVKSSSET
jgi:hypothetical protein